MRKTLHRGFKSREGRVKRREKLWVEERRLERSWVTCKNPSLLSQTDRLAPVEYVMLTPAKSPRPNHTYMDDSSPKDVNSTRLLRFLLSCRWSELFIPGPSENVWSYLVLRPSNRQRICFLLDRRCRCLLHWGANPSGQTVLNNQSYMLFRNRPRDLLFIITTT